MLESVDLKQELSKSEYRERRAELTAELRALQVQHWQADIPTIIVFEGWDCSGKGESISTLAKIFDPRGFRVHVTFEPTPEEDAYPFLWRFWNNVPSRGKIALFDRSWYQRVLTERVEGKVREEQWKRAFEQIRCFEKQLTDSGVRILKFFLHISKEEQRRRFEAFEADPHESWRVRDEDWQHHLHYSEFVTAAEEMIDRTSSESAPWKIVPAEDLRHAFSVVQNAICQNMKTALELSRASVGGASQDNTVPPNAPTERTPTPLLDSVDLTLRLEKKEYQEKLRPLQTELRDLLKKTHERGIASMIVYEGWDAAGKGGNIRRLTERLDPRHYDVVAISKPVGEEASNHYLWRFWKQIPRDGHMAIFDRSWYGRVLVERVEGFCSEPEWRRSFREIDEFESQVAAHGTVIVKFWIHIDREEQANRFRAREVTPHKQWKITAEDWRNREKWDQYEPAVEEMLARTSTDVAPWTVIAGTDKRYARIQAIETVVARLKSVVE